MHAVAWAASKEQNSTSRSRTLWSIYLRHNNVADPGHHLPRPPVKCTIAGIMADIKGIDHVDVSENSASTTDKESNVVVKMTAKGIPLVPQPSDDPDDPLVHTFMCRNQHYATV
jgi:hypothetical protein